MTLHELLKRPHPVFAVDGGGGGAGEDDDALGDALAGLEDDTETEDERIARETEEAQAAEEERINALAKDMAQKIVDERVAKIGADAAARQTTTQIQQQDPNAVRQARIRAIAEEYDEDKKEEMRVALVKDEMRAEFGQQLVHSATQGAIETIKRLAPDAPEQAMPYYEQIVRENRLTPDFIEEHPHVAGQVRDAAIGMAYRNNALPLQEPAKPAPRTPVPKLAPAGGGAPRDTSSERRTPEQNAAIKAAMDNAGEYAFVGNDPKSGKMKKPEEVFDASEMAEILALAGGR